MKKILGRQREIMTYNVGFIGLGIMGWEIASQIHLADCIAEFYVWNRTRSKAESFSAQYGTSCSSTVEELIENSDIIFLMLTDEFAVNNVLQGQNPDISYDLHDKLIVHMGTTTTSFSKSISQEISKLGGRYVEAPVSGSKLPARNGELVLMLAGDAADAEIVGKIMRPVCRANGSHYCGAVPTALATKHATNIILAPFLIGLAEASLYLRHVGADIESFGNILLQGQISNDIMKAKIPKIINQNFDPQVALKNGLQSAKSAMNSAASSGLNLEQITCTTKLLEKAREAGFGDIDILGIETYFARQNEN